MVSDFEVKETLDCGFEICHELEDGEFLNLDGCLHVHFFGLEEYYFSCEMSYPLKD